MGILDPITSCIQRRAKSKSITATSSTEPRSRSRCRCRQRLTAWSMELTGEKKTADGAKEGEEENSWAPHEGDEKSRKLVKRSPSQTASIRIVESEGGDDVPSSFANKDNNNDDDSDSDSNGRTKTGRQAHPSPETTEEGRNPPRNRIEDIPEESEPTTPEKTPPPPPATTPATPLSKTVLQNKPLPLPPVSTPSPRPSIYSRRTSSRYTPDPLASDPATDEEWSPKRASSLFRLSSRRSLIEIVTLLQTTAQAAAAAAATAPRRLHPLGRGGSPGVPAKSPLRRGVTIPPAESTGSSSEGTTMGSDSETEVSLASSTSSIMLPPWTSSKAGFVRGSTAASAPVTDTIRSGSSGEASAELTENENNEDGKKRRRHRRRAAEVFDQPKPLRWNPRRGESESRLEGEIEGTEKTLFQ